MKFALHHKTHLMRVTGKLLGAPCRRVPCSNVVHLEDVVTWLHTPRWLAPLVPLVHRPTLCNPLDHQTCRGCSAPNKHHVKAK